MTKNHISGGAETETMARNAAINFQLIPAKKHHENAGHADQQGGTEIRLLDDQEHRQQNDHQPPVITLGGKVGGR